MADASINKDEYYIGFVTMFDDRTEVSCSFATRRAAEQWCRDQDHGSGGRVRSAYTCRQVETWDDRGREYAAIDEVDGSRESVAFP